MQVITKLSSLLETIKTNRLVQVLLIILVIGGGMRYYGLHNAENTDEYNEVVEALRVASGKFNTNRWHKKGYQNILAVEYGVYFVTGYVLNMFTSPMDFAAKIIRDMEPLFLIGRYTTATMGTLSILLLFLIGQRVFNQRVALIASALLAVTTMHVWVSHLVGTDVPLTFFFLLSLYFITRFYDSLKLSDYILAAFFGAVAINMKILGVGIGVIFLAAHYFVCKKSGKQIKEYIFSREIGYSALAFVAGYLISNPAVAVGLKEWVMSFIWRYGIYTNVYEDVPYMGGNPYFIYIKLMYQEFGFPLFLLIAGGLGYAIYKRSNWDYIFLAFLVSLYLILANTGFLIQNRYMMTMLPVMFLLAARLIDVMIGKVPVLAKQRGISMLVIYIAAAAFPFYNSIVFTRTLTEDNTSKISKQWIERNVPSGSKILMDAGRTIITSGPRLNQSRANLERKLEMIENLKEGETFDSPQVKIVDSYSSIYFELMLQYIPPISYDITSTELGRNIKSIDYYRCKGFDYFVHNVDDIEYLTIDPVWRGKFPDSAKFYDSVEREYKLMEIFEPSKTRSGPTIKVYKIDKEECSTAKIIHEGQLKG